MNRVTLLDWRDASHFDRTADLPCTLCSKPTPLRSHDGEAVHKACAELWNHTHPEAHRVHAHGRDAGTTRFHNDTAATPARSISPRIAPPRAEADRQAPLLPHAA